MAANSTPEHLASVRYVALVVRMAIAEDARLVHGEILDGEGQSCGHFRVWAELAAALQACAADLDPEDPPAPSASL